MKRRANLMTLLLASAVWLAVPAHAEKFFFNTGAPDGKLGALSRPASTGKLETETADDFVLTEPTIIGKATIHGLLTGGTTVSNITRVEVEIYHIFPADSNTARTPQVPTRANSPSDVEIDAATRDSASATLGGTASVLSPAFMVSNTVVNGIHASPNQFTGGEGAATGAEVEIDITFNPPIFLPANHYFFRPEVQVTGGDFLFLSAPKPIVVPPGTLFPPNTTDLQAWIRNSDLAPDWLRIGTDITHQGPFNMSFSLTGNTIPGAGTPGKPNCHGQTISAMAHEFGGIGHAAPDLGYSSVDALQNAVDVFCK